MLQDQCPLCTIGGKLFDRRYRNIRFRRRIWLFPIRPIRRSSAELHLKVGVEIHEYQPGMIHTKAMTVDGLWVVIGSTNFDSRSFALNDEVNLATVDGRLAADLEGEFSLDLARCAQITYETWLGRSLPERVGAALGRLIERQE